MEEKIGKVTLNYKYYSGEDHYSDGDGIEEKLLEICRSGRQEETLRESSSWPVLYHLSDIRGNIIEWYPMDKSETVLEIGSGCGAISGFLCRKAGRVVGIELSKRRSLINAYRNSGCGNLEIIVGNFREIGLEEKFDYVMLIGVLEYAGSYMGGNDPYGQMLEKVKGYLKPGGKVVIAIENKMGLKYLNGAKEDHTGKAFAGIEDYRGIRDVRTFSKPELCRLLDRAGLQDRRFYYPVPDYKLPDTIYSDGHMPQEGEIRTWGQNYDDVRVALYNEGIAFDQVCRDGKFDYFSNSFLVVCNETGNDIQYVHYAGIRNKEYQTRTVLTGNGQVEKSYMCSCARRYDIFAEMKSNFGTLQDEFPNIKYLEPEVRGNVLRYPYIKGGAVETKLTCMLHDTDRLISEFRRIIGTCFTVDSRYLSDFTVTSEYGEFFGRQYVKTEEKSLKVTNIDMTLWNLIMGADGIVCIDYEWVFSFPVPFEFVIYRCVELFYRKYQMYLMHKYSVADFLIACGIKKENIPVYSYMNQFFYDATLKEGRIEGYKKASGMIEIKI